MINAIPTIAHVFRTIRAALLVIGGLSNPSKMPGYSWSIPATTCQTGSRLRRIVGSTCSLCYALKGTYLFASTRKAMARRWAILQRALADPAFASEWVAAFAYVLNRRAENTWKRMERGHKVRNDARFFRLHDSGDFQSLQHVALCMQIARMTPGVRHWFPTREPKYIRAYLALGETIPDNVCVRLSVPMIDGPATGLIAKLAEHPRIALSFVHADTLDANAERCSAPDTDGFCGDCRRCWEPTVNISYHVH